ncbi:HFL074Wp [Eremothecium sinecaudum]|uniref:HFL074Wp n=1 Tax=Eremothecium sinecaudum TaxID=45286 RepID=A0A109UXS5_9SACH|nr:HFL074Wp [Eremothecium sinecaudum]AMD21782.1 HFL074Wp [Eremothecium sinecaudum]
METHSIEQDSANRARDLLLTEKLRQQPPPIEKVCGKYDSQNGLESSKAALPSTPRTVGSHITLQKSICRDTDDLLQQEYNSVKQENDRLHSIISKLKQEIDLYTRLLQHQTGVSRRTHVAQRSSSLTVLESMLVNTSKRRKKTSVVARGHPRDCSPAQILKDAHHDVMLGAGTKLSPGPQSMSSAVPDDLAPEELLLMDKLTEVLKGMD